MKMKQIEKIINWVYWGVSIAFLAFLSWDNAIWTSGAMNGGGRMTILLFAFGMGWLVTGITAKGSLTSLTPPPLN